MKNKLPLLVLVIILVGIVAFAYYNKKNATCTDPNCQDHKQPVGPPTLPDGPPGTPDQPPPGIVNGKTYTYAEGLALCKTTKVPMFVVCGADWCFWCKRLDTTLKSSEIQSVLSKYINVHVDVDKEKDVAAKLKVSGKGVPIYMFVNENEQVVKQGSGYKTVNQMQQWLKLPAVVEEDSK